MPAFVLVASPLVGPAGWQWLTAALIERGQVVIVPELARDPVLPTWTAHVDCVVRQVPDDTELVLVGHSASGRLIPLIAERLRPDCACVFVDAQLPVDLLPPAPDDWFVQHVEEIAVDGVLPPWSEWWGDGAWEALVPDPGRRTQLEAALPHLRLAEVIEEAPAPRRAVTRAAYLQLSAIYDPEATIARDRGWPVRRLDGKHLHMAVAETEVADALLDLVDQLPR